MRQYFISALSAILGSLVLWSCHIKPQLGELVNDMVVQTFYDSTANFDSYSTYAIAQDTLGRVSNSSNDTLIVSDYSKQVTAVLRNTMNGRGYTKVDKSQNPDLAVIAYIVDNLNVSQSVNYYGGYYGYPGYYYPSYYGYGGFYNYPSVTTYVSNTAVLVIELVDLKNLDGQGRASSVWTCYIGDVLSSVDPYGKSVEAVTQAFDQSPYLKK